MPENTALVAVDQLNPVELFEKDGLKSVLDELQKRALDFTADVSTPSGRKEIASQAYKVARSKTLIDDMGKNHTKELRAALKSVDAKRKEARDFCDGLKQEVRQDLTDWEAEQERIAQEEERKKDDRLQKRMKEIYQYPIEADRTVFLDQNEVREWSDREYGQFLLERKEAYRVEQDALEKERLEREAEEKRLAEERAEQERQAAELRKQQEAMEAERRKLEDERKAIEDEKRKAEETKRLEEQRKQMEAEAKERERIAAEKAAQEERDRVEREKREAEEAAAKAEAELKRQEALQPDKEKIIAYADALWAVPVPIVSEGDAEDLMKSIIRDFRKFVESIRENAEAL